MTEEPIIPGVPQDHLERLRQITAALANQKIVEGDAIIVGQLEDGDLNIVYGSEAAAATFGYTKGEFEHLSVAKIMPDRLRKRHLQGVAQFAKEGAGPILGRAIRVPGLRKDGSEFELLLIIRPSLNHPATFVATLRATEDVIDVE